MRRTVLIGLFLVAGMTGVQAGQAAAQTTVKEKYQAVQVDRFEIKNGVQFPADYLLTLQEEILKRLQETRQFPEVLRPGENPQAAGSQVLRLTGTINHFKPGSRTKRYVVGFGAGNTEIFAHLVFVDRATGQVVLTQEVRGMMAGGFIGGESLNVTRDFARKVANSIKLMSEMRLPAAGVTPPVDSAAAPPPAAERHTVAVVSSDFDAAEKKLNEEGAAGYRVVEFSNTSSKNAEVVLEKSPAAGTTFQYRVLHARLPGSLQKNLNQSAGEGFRLCPHTLGQFGGVMTVIVEKAPAPAAARCEYRVHQTLRVSSAKKDVAKDQAQGFTLAETFEQPGGVHLVILEKASLASGE